MKNATAGREPGNLVAGTLCALFGGALLLWAARGPGNDTSGVAHRLSTQLRLPSDVSGLPLSPFEMAFALAAIVVGLLAVLGRPAARAGVLLLASFLLFTSGRLLIDLLPEARRASLGDLTGLALAVDLIGLLVAVLLFALLLRSEESGESRLAKSSTAVIVTGAIVLATGSARLLWYLLLAGIPGPSDANVHRFALLVAVPVVGLLAVLRRRAARGTAYTLTGMVLIVEVGSVFNLPALLSTPLAVTLLMLPILPLLALVIALARAR